MGLIQDLFGQMMRVLLILFFKRRGGEQGCPLMPALYSLAQHDALVEADGHLLPTELLFAFLDDLYVVTTRGRAHEAFETVTECVERKAGVRTHLGKLKAWSTGGGPAPIGLSAIGPDVWTADKPDNLNGLVVLCGAVFGFGWLWVVGVGGRC